MKKWIALGIFIVNLFILGACSSSNSSKDERKEIVGIVEDVRIVSEAKYISKDNKSLDAGIGALVGGVITGGLGGAVVGAAIGADGNKPQVTLVIEPRACKFFVNISGEGRFEFMARLYSAGIDKCLLLRAGDRVGVLRVLEKDGSAEYWCKDTRGIKTP